MKPLLLNTNDTLGGAAIATYRLHRSLQDMGVFSQLFVQKKTGSDSTVFAPHTIFGKRYSSIRSIIDRSPTFFYKNRDPSLWSPAWLPNLISNRIAKFNPDIVHLHWICGGFVPVSEIQKISKPIVWTLHDMWPMTGGCHYSGTCIKYQNQCGACPLLGSLSGKDLSFWVLKRKIRFWQNLDITIVSPSKWLAHCAKNSSVFKNCTIEIIPNCLDTSRFKPIEKDIARTRLSLPHNKLLILFGAMNATSDKRKGFHLLRDSLKILSDNNNFRDAELVLFGDLNKTGQLDIKMKIHSMGRIQDDAGLSLLYSAADVFVAPSIQENLSNTVMESLACGTPVVAFNIGGMPDMIDHKKNGYLAEPFECQDLADGIAWVLSNNTRMKFLSDNARGKVLREFDHLKIAQNHIKLYQEMIHS